MSTFAEIDAAGNVLRVIVIDAQTLATGKWGDPKNFVETKMDGSEKKNYAGPGLEYDKIRDAFIQKQPYASWTLDEQKCQWVPPTPMPKDGKMYAWDETTRTWKEVK